MYLVKGLVNGSESYNECFNNDGLLNTVLKYVKSHYNYVCII